MVIRIAVPCGNNIVTLMSKVWDLCPLARSGLRAIFTTNLDCSLSSMLTILRWLDLRLILKMDGPCSRKV